MTAPKKLRTPFQHWVCSVGVNAISAKAGINDRTVSSWRFEDKKPNKTNLEKLRAAFPELSYDTIMDVTPC